MVRRQKKYFENNIKELKKEINKQILRDGGHEERSASYHLLILDRLVDCGFFINMHMGYKPKWLINVVQKMTIWVEKVSLFNNKYPRFNDCIFDQNYSLQQIKNYAYAFLNLKHEKLKGVRSILSENSFVKIKIDKKFDQEIIQILNNKELIDLPDTGWTIVKPGASNWELLFKCGEPCPKHLPAHCHSDLLSFELNYKDKPIFSEHGTSVYGNNKYRMIERSSLAHNVFQISYPINSFSKDEIRWIEPVDIFGNFRAGRKPSPIFRECFKDKLKRFEISGAHNGYKSFGANHLRKINLRLISDFEVQFTLIDYLKCSKRLAWRQFWHLGPEYDVSIFKSIISQLNKNHNFEYQIEDTWHSRNFGVSFPRKVYL